MANRISQAEICSRLFDIQYKHPELRTCQILSIAAAKAGWVEKDLFYIPDETILNGLTMMAQEYT